MSSERAIVVMAALAIFTVGVWSKSVDPSASNPTSQPASRPAVVGKVVYSARFEGEAGPEWSKQIVASTPKDSRRYLGQFGPEAVTLSLQDLPPHKYVRLSFDLFVMNPWDGSSDNWGHCPWMLDVVGQKVLLYTTFSNCGFFTDNNVQAFPDSYPVAGHPGWTGSAEKQTLGYTFSWGGPNRTFGCDSVYKFSLPFPHEGDKIQLRFQAFKRALLKDKAWGLANVSVEVMDHPPLQSLSISDMETLWADLASDEPLRAHKATWTLAGAGQDAVKFLGGKLLERPNGEEVDRLIRDLDDNSWRVRENASRKLHTMGNAVALALTTAQAQTDSLEVKARLAELIETLPGKQKDDPQHLRLDRALQALEIINSPDALQVLKHFARKPRDADALKREYDEQHKKKPSED